MSEKCNHEDWVKDACYFCASESLAAATARVTRLENVLRVLSQAETLSPTMKDIARIALGEGVG